MRKPVGFEELSVAMDQMSQGPYPAQGFLPVWDAELGNGDYFGLYWLLGKEQSEPIVCDMMHDSWTIEPSFSSTEKFLLWLKANDGDRGEVEIDDPEFAPAYVRRAREHSSNDQTDEAIRELQIACRQLPEVSSYWSQLAKHLRKAGRVTESSEAALNSFRANWSFGRPPDGTLRMVQGAMQDENLATDPIVRRSKLLTMRFGGVKENAEYSLLRECIGEYLQGGQVLHAITMHQNYAFMMQGETVSFRERQGFSIDEWRVEFSEICKLHLGDSRSKVDG